jgi:5-methylthioribose kinase
MLLTEKFDPQIESYLKKKGWINPSANIYAYTKAGNGNMNFVARVHTTCGNIILKQSRPYVEKYRHIPAPVERILVEQSFYETIQHHNILSTFSPRIIGFDEQYYIMAMEDLGDASDFTGLYTGDIEITEQQMESLTYYLIALHETRVQVFAGNSGMKSLNHEHIFVYPFAADNGFNLDAVQPGLQAIAMPVKQNNSLKNNIAVLGKRYLAQGTSLLHGDFYPGSWLKTADGLKIIDTEFAFAGDAEFDWGVLMAHLKMAKQQISPLDFTEKYHKGKNKLHPQLVCQYTGVEILRRLIGIAQLPLALGIEEKKSLIEEACNLITTYN